MPRKSSGEYPDNWPEIAKNVKDAAGWKCVRCHHPHHVESGHVLTVHHLDMNPANNEWWNLAALCQRCHLHIQSKVVMYQQFMFDHSEWFKPFVAGYYASRLGLRTDKSYVYENMNELLEYGSLGDLPEVEK